MEGSCDPADAGRASSFLRSAARGGCTRPCTFCSVAPHGNPEDPAYYFGFLGRSGLATASLTQGGNVFGWTADEAASFAVLDAFVNGGFNLIDTADTCLRWAPGHQGGESETVIGHRLRRSRKRHRVLIVTKAGKPMVEEGSGRTGLSLRRIRQAVHDSLTREPSPVWPAWLRQLLQLVEGAGALRPASPFPLGPYRLGRWLRPLG